MTDQTATAEAEASAAPAQTRQWKDIIAEIKDKSLGDEVDHLERVMRFNWTGKDWHIDKPNPANPDWVSFAAFHDAEEIRVYEGRKEPKEDEYPIRRLTLSKRSTDMVIEVMSVDRMIELMVEEIYIQAELPATGFQDGAEKERIAVVDFLRKQHPATTSSTLAGLIAKGAHDDDEDDKPAAAKPNGQTS